KNTGPWRNAAWFEDADTNSEALIFSSELEQREVRVRVAGDYPPYVFGKLEEILRDTFKRYPGAQPESLIPCTCKPGCKNAHAWKTVLDRQRAGKTEISCGVEDVPIAKLLAGITPRNTNEAQLAILYEMRRMLSA